jgi:hypothetical protein
MGQGKSGHFFNDNKYLEHTFHPISRTNLAPIEWLRSTSASEVPGNRRCQKAWTRRLTWLTQNPRALINRNYRVRAVRGRPCTGPPRSELQSIDIFNRSYRPAASPGKTEQSPPVSRILFGTLAGAATIIPLGQRSLASSCHLPAASPSRIVGRLFGVAPRRDCPFHPN